MLHWDDLRFFLAIARTGSLSAAARQLHVTQSTVGRRLATMQAALGVRLIRRAEEAFALTAAGDAILERVERMEAEALSVERCVGGHDARLGGVVRVSSSQLVATTLLAPALAELHAAAPAILVEALPFGTGEAVARHKAEIGVQLRRPTSPDIVIRSLGTIAFALYASADYIARRGLPGPEDGYAGHQVATLLDDRETSLQAAWLARHMRRGDVVLRADSYETLHSAALAGGGLAVLPRFRADPEPRLRRIATAAPIQAADIWLSVHRENREIARIRMVIDCLAGAVRSRSELLDPKSPGLRPGPHQDRVDSGPA